MDAQTGQPIEGVSVQRLGDIRARSGDIPKGGEAAQRMPKVFTGADGTFVMDSERVLVLFRDYGWNSLTLVFQHRDYTREILSYTLRDSTNSPSGEPVIAAGDVRMQPRHPDNSTATPVRE